MTGGPAAPSCALSTTIPATRARAWGLPMREPEDPVIDVGALLEKVEAAAPIDAVEAVATALGDMVRAREVALLIADFTGRAVVRLTSAGRVAGARSHGVEQAETLPLSGTVYEQVLRTQQVDVAALDGGARMIVPVTDRGDAIGLLEVVLPRTPPAAESHRHQHGGTRLGLRRHRRPPPHRRLRVGPALPAVRSRRGNPAAAAARLLHVRGGTVHPRRLAGAGELGRRGHL